jgi:hypothetical protein
MKEMSPRYPHTNWTKRALQGQGMSNPYIKKFPTTESVREICPFLNNPANSAKPKCLAGRAYL